MIRRLERVGFLGLCKVFDILCSVYGRSGVTVCKFILFYARQSGGNRAVSLQVVLVFSGRVLI